jgi:hypothetical protein
MPRVGFESTIPAFERAKTVHALDRAATVIGRRQIYGDSISNASTYHLGLILEMAVMIVMTMYDVHA